ncbi:MAG: YabP/YqfC family sporulation protein [Oscillospiraceae bacterium]|nr:YabP/YqfC family sporulation protein [Oscillospiraceae bacterium]
MRKISRFGIVLAEVILMRKRRTVRALEKAAEVFSLPSEAAGVSRVTITGNSRAHIENHRGLLSYAAEEISVNAGRLILRFRGAGLEIEAMSDLELVIKGEILALEYLT